MTDKERYEQAQFIIEAQDILINDILKLNEAYAQTISTFLKEKYKHE